METLKTSDRIIFKQKRLYLLILLGIVGVLGGIAFLLQEESATSVSSPKGSFDVVSKEIKPENIRLSHLETLNDVLDERMQSLEKSVLNLSEEKALLQDQRNHLALETTDLKEKIEHLESELKTKSELSSISPSSEGLLPASIESNLKIWEVSDRKEDKNVLFEIPAGTVLKAVLVSGADCSVAVQKPTGPNMVLLRPLDNGKLPRKVRVPLKGSVIIGNAIGDLSSERVYIRAERMTLVEKNGSFVETEVSAYISGEDGREGMRGIVVDRSGQIITRAAFAAFLQGIGQSVQATLNNQTIEKLSEIGDSKAILNLDLLRNSTLQGSSTALSKMAEYYIKRAEQLQPAIQIAAGRVVDIIFTKTIKIGEVDLKKKFDKERELRLQGGK